jgi:hypothetical protein
VRLKLAAAAAWLVVLAALWWAKCNHGKEVAMPEPNSGAHPRIQSTMHSISSN